jgi:hypothetical protein
MGPTIEMMAVHQDYRDKNIPPVLWYRVRCFIAENRTGMHETMSPGNVMVKRDKFLINTPRVNAHGVPVTDKDFFSTIADFPFENDILPLWGRPDLRTRKPYYQQHRCDTTGQTYY